MSLCTLSGMLRDRQGAAAAQAVCRFLPAPVGHRVGGSVHVPLPVTVEADPSGALSVQLVPGVYTMRVRLAGGMEVPPVLVDVPDAPTASLEASIVELDMPQSIFDAAAASRRAVKAAEEILAAEVHGGVTPDRLVASPAITQATGVRPFPSRGDMEAASIPDFVTTWSQEVGGRLITFLRDAEGTAVETANGVRGSPAQLPTPLHWGARCDAAPAANAAAFNACAAWRGQMAIPAGRYRIEGTVAFRPAGWVPCSATGEVPEGSQIGLTCIGEGQQVTILEQTDPSQDTLYFRHADEAIQWGIRPTVRGLSIHAPGATWDDEGHAVRIQQSLNGVVDDLTIDGPSYGVTLERAAQTWLTRVYFRTALRAAGERARVFVTLDHDPILQLGSSFGSYLSALETQAGRGVWAALRVRALDGTLVSLSHFGHCEHHIVFDPDGTGGRTFVSGLTVNTCWFDPGLVSGQHISRESVLMRARGAPNSVTFNGLRVSDCVWRKRGTEPVFGFDRDPGGCDAFDLVRSIAFNDNTVRQFDGPGFDFRMAPDVSSLSKLRDVVVGGNSFVPTVNPAGNDPVIIVAGRHVTAHGNTVDQGNWAQSSAAPIVVDAQSSIVQIYGQIFGNQTGLPPDECVSIAPGASHVSVWGIVTALGGFSPAAIVETGTGNLGAWIKWADGRMEIRREEQLTAVDVDISFGALFRSENLIVDRDFPQPFVAGSRPNVQVTAWIANAMGWAVVSGPHTHDRWPTNIRVASATGMFDRIVNVTLRAEGHWK